jgi:hypothetical protein
MRSYPHELSTRVILSEAKRSRRIRGEALKVALRDSSTSLGMTRLYIILNKSP